MEIREVKDPALARRAGLENYLLGEILGQADAMRVLARALLRGEMGWVEPGRPRSFLLLLGETGVGKTESVLSAARHLYSTDEYVVRLDMAEYADRATGLGRLVGTDRSDPGLLGRELARVAGLSGRGGGILLLDEIEKAHPDVTRLFLGMEAARLTTSAGETLALEAWHVICTSNLGSESARELAGGVPYAYLRRTVEEEARGHFGSAVFARFTETLVYRSLDYGTQRGICAQKLRRKIDFLESRLGCVVNVGPGVLEHLLRRGYHRDLGARMMRNTIDREVGDAAVDAELAAEPGASREWCLEVAAGRLRLRPAVQVGGV